MDIFHDEKGVFALVVLTNTADVRDAIYKLWNEKIGGRRITIALDSISDFSHDNPEQRRRLNPGVPKFSERPQYSITLASVLHVPSHLFHCPQPDVEIVKPSGKAMRPEFKAIAENRRIYIKDLPFGTTEDILYSLLKDYSMY